VTQEETGGENGASDRKDGVHFLEERGVAILYVWTMYIVLLICCHQKAERERDREVVVVVVKGGEKKT
jgi:hypothetical protein